MYKIGLLCLLLLFLVACQPQIATPQASIVDGTTTVLLDPTAMPTTATQTPVEPSPMPTATSTAVPTHTPTPIPSATPTNTPTATAVPPQAVSLEGLSFTLDSRVAEQIYPGQTSDLAVARVLFAPEGYCGGVGCVTVYDAQRFATDIPGGQSIIAEMQPVLAKADDSYIPTWGAALLLQVQTHPLAFQNGHGNRAVVMRGQDGFYVNNSSVVYDYFGLTSDGRYLINVTIPIDAQILFSNQEIMNQDFARVTDTAVPIPTVSPADDAYFEAIWPYNKAIAVNLEALDSSGFTPDLALLDALVASLVFSPEG